MICDNYFLSIRVVLPQTLLTLQILVLRLELLFTGVCITSYILPVLLEAQSPLFPPYW